MGFIVAAAPLENWARENSPFLAVLVCAILGLLVFRLVVRTLTRMLLLALLLGITLFVAAERDEIAECTQTCSCQLAGFDVDVPFCDETRRRIAT